MNRTGSALAAVGTFTGLIAGYSIGSQQARRGAVIPVPKSTPVDVVSTAGDPVRDPICRYGCPTVGNVKFRDGHVLSFDRRLRNPAWVIEDLGTNMRKAKSNKDDLRKHGAAAGRADRQRSTFKEDESTPEQFRALLKDYRGSGFDRGHQAPAADFKHSQAAMDETFLLSNISPQVGKGMNRDYWARIETWVRTLAQDERAKRYGATRGKHGEKQGDLLVATGPLFLPKQDKDGNFIVQYRMIGSPPNVAVPTHFYKVVFLKTTDGEYQMGAFVVPNEPIADGKHIVEFMVPVDFVEKHAGVVFFGNVDRSKVRPLCPAADICALPPPDFWKQAKKQDKVKTD